MKKLLFTLIITGFFPLFSEVPHSKKNGLTTPKEKQGKTQDKKPDKTPILSTTKQPPIPHELSHTIQQIQAPLHTTQEYQPPTKHTP